MACCTHKATIMKMKKKPMKWRHWRRRFWPAWVSTTPTRIAADPAWGVENQRPPHNRLYSTITAISFSQRHYRFLSWPRLSAVAIAPERCPQKNQLLAETRALI